MRRALALAVLTCASPALAQVPHGAEIDPAVAVRQAFGRILPLGALEAEALARVVEARNRVSGLSIAYPRGRWAQLLGRRRAEANRRDYYRNLERTCHGNLRAALDALHRLDTAEAPGEDLVKPCLPWGDSRTTFA